MKPIQKLILCGLTSFSILTMAFAGSHGTEKVSSPSGTSEKISPLMNQNLGALLKLEQYFSSPEKFSDPKNSADIEANLEILQNVGKTLPKMIGQEKPGLKAISSLFSEYISSTQTNYKLGYREYARNQIRTITGFCMACHTAGDQKLNAQVFDEALPPEANSLERADFYAATRQFDKALEAYENVVFNRKAESEKDFIDASRAIRSYLSISVRVKKTPKLTYAFLTKVEMQKNLLSFFERDLKQWKADVAAWMQEKRQSENDLPVKQLLAKAYRLIELARKQQKFAADHTGDVNFLRATTYAHLASDRSKDSADRAQAFFLLGQSYAALSDPFLWQLDGMYFQACIEEKPHSTISRNCFKHLASGIYLGYSGSSGVNIPRDDFTRLTRFRKLAE